jgi:hypothetical protein
MKYLAILAISTGLLTASQAMEQPSFHTKGIPTGKPTGTLKPGQYWWKPELSPRGPVVVLVSIPEQTMHVRIPSRLEPSDQSAHGESADN